MVAPKPSGEDGLGEVFSEERPRGGVEMGRALSSVRAGLFGRPRRVITMSRYVLLGRIGRGGAGVVYEAYDPELNRKVAIKLLHSKSDSKRSEERRARLLREAQAIASLSHPNVVTVHDVGTYEEQALGVSATLDGASADIGDLDLPPRGVFVVMEYVEGQSLQRWLQAGARTWEEALGVLIPAGRGLAAAHAAGLVHRDFKPSNVLVGDDGRVRVVDFGLARAVADADRPTPSVERLGPEPSRSGSVLERPITERGTIMGTPPYMSPEQHRGETADARTDQYGFSVALYEALYGELPFRARKLEDLERLKLSRTMEPAPDGVRIPAWLRAVVLRGLEPKPAQRFDTMEAMLAVLERGAGIRRRGWRVGLAIAGLGLAGVVIMQMRGESSCPDPVSRLAGVWDGPTRTAIESSFAATRMPYAAASWASVARELDAYLAEWTRQRDEACQATVVRGEQSPELMGARMLCLDRRLVRVGELTRVLARADAQVVESAVENVGELEALDECEDVERMRAAIVALEGAQRPEVIAIDEELARAEALARAGRIPEGLASVERARAAAHQAGHAPSEARVRLLEGSILRAAGNADDAATALHDAWVQAEELGHDEVAIRALTELVLVAGYELGELAEADRLADLARAKLQRRELGETAIAQLELNVGILRLQQGRYDEALASLNNALGRYEHEVGAEHPRVATVLNSTGAVLSASGRHAEAALRYERALSIFEAALGTQHPTVAVILLNLGTIAVQRGAHDTGLGYHRRATAILEQTLGPDHPQLARALNNVATAYMSVGRNVEALSHLERSRAIKDRTVGSNHVSYAATLNNLATVLSALGRHELALAEHFRALEIRRGTYGDEHPEVAASLTNIGWEQLELGRLDDALENHRRALAVLQDTHGRDSMWLVQPLRGIGLSLLGLGRQGESLAPLERALELSSSGETDPIEWADSEFALARALIETDPARARSLASDARLRFDRVARPDKAGPVAAWLEEHAP